MKHILPAFALAAAAATGGCSSHSADTSGIDPQLAREIGRIKAIDNHAHPVRPTAPGEKPDDEFDALPVDNLEPQSDPIRQRPKSPEVMDARAQLFANDKAAAVRAHGADYATWILDRLGIETMLSNRVAMGPGLPSHSKKDC